MTYVPVGHVTVMRMAYRPDSPGMGSEVVAHEYSFKGSGNVPFCTESGSAWSSRSVRRSSSSMRDVASASASVMCLAFSAVRIPLPTDSNAATDVIPTMAIATTASNSEMPRRARRSERVRTGDSVERIYAHDERHRRSAHDHRVGEGRAGGLKDVDEAQLVGFDPFADVQFECAHRQHSAACGCRGVDLVLERFWIDPEDDRRVVIERHFACVTQQAHELVGPARGLFRSEPRERRRCQRRGQRQHDENHRKLPEREARTVPHY